MTTTISGTTSCSQVVDGSITQADLAANVAGNGPAFRAYATTTTPVTAVPVVITLGGESYDTNNCFAGSAFTPNVAGYYQISGAISFVGGMYTVAAAIAKNGSVVSYGSMPNPGSRASVSDLVYCNGTTDAISLMGYSSTTQNCNAEAIGTYLSGFLARAA